MVCHVLKKVKLFPSILSNSQSSFTKSPDPYVKIIFKLAPTTQSIQYLFELRDLIIQPRSYCVSDCTHAHSVRQLYSTIIEYQSKDSQREQSEL